MAHETITPSATTGTSVGVSTDEAPKGKIASSSLPVKYKVKQTENDIEEWQQNSLQKALQDASQKRNGEGPMPNESSIATGKAGWCYIGEEQGIRTCSEVGVNDMCLSGDIFPTQAVCMNPKLRA